jgi:nitroimidazol reductase NimA-like FMN-containing flavoprotein (pyridoxamine 5'-phosphate oxidase superfamily)
MGTEDLRATLRDLLMSQRLAVLATQVDKHPYTSLVAFAATEDLRLLVFATDRATHKFANLSANPGVAMLVDDRSHREADLSEATAVTATGCAEEAQGEEKNRLMALLLGRHPSLKPFLNSSGCALVKVTVDAYLVVTRFQEVMELLP